MSRHPNQRMDAAKIAFIKSNLGPMTPTEISHLIGVSPTLVRKYAAREGVAYRGPGAMWSAEELDAVAKYWGRYDRKYLEQAIPNRGYNAIKSMARVLGLGRPYTEYMPAQTLARKIGICRETFRLMVELEGLQHRYTTALPNQKRSRPMCKFYNVNDTMAAAQRFFQRETMSQAATRYGVTIWVMSRLIDELKLVRTTGRFWRLRPQEWDEHFRTWGKQTGWQYVPAATRTKLQTLLGCASLAISTVPTVGDSAPSKARSSARSASLRATPHTASATV